MKVRCPSSLDRTGWPGMNLGIVDLVYEILSSQKIRDVLRIGSSQEMRIIGQDNSFSTCLVLAAGVYAGGPQGWVQTPLKICGIEDPNDRWSTGKCVLTSVVPSSSSLI